MKKPNRSEFGYSKKTGWQDERDRDLYEVALLQWYNQPRQIGKTRSSTRPIHQSWEPVLKHFDSSNPQRSQGAFCRWANLNRGTFSAMQCKYIPLRIANLVEVWVWLAQGKEVGDGFKKLNSACENAANAIKAFQEAIEHEE